MSEPLEVIVQDVSSGRIHKRYRVEGQKELLSYEADNADEAGEAIELDRAAIGDTPHDAFCKRCFPEFAS
jgi:hypothetical protein